MVFEFDLADILIKVGMFVLVQALVYLILSNSSEIFSKNKMRSLSFKPARSASIRRMLASISDVPQTGEALSSASDMRSSAQELDDPY
ncbi:hypothetical protein RJ641_034074 [Dillenia turbinata]|uniref:Uncharacterized protein n=1 Tax=Dillenia turbinata TaxID=194707 RepID=A0AAN8VNI2_9MAGN